MRFTTPEMRMQVRTPADQPPSGLLDPLLKTPAQSAVLCDIDGTIAPIAERADEAQVDDAAQGVLRRLAERYALVGCVSGRRAADARHMVGLGTLHYIGNHGYELLAPRSTTPVASPLLSGREDDAAAFARRWDTRELRSLRLRIEDKGPIFAFHWRGAPDEDAAESKAKEIAVAAAAAGLEPHWGRKVLEVRPPVGISKGTAIASLLEEAGARHVLYGGDDRTDVDAFRRLRELTGGGRLQTAVCVGVASEEGPAEVAAEADLVVEGVAEFVTVLRRLAGTT
jgi:trehalose 6-phosphate phosphatase